MCACVCVCLRVSSAQRLKCKHVSSACRLCKPLCPVRPANSSPPRSNERVRHVYVHAGGKIEALGTGLWAAPRGAAGAVGDIVETAGGTGMMTVETVCAVDVRDNTDAAPDTMGATPRAEAGGGTLRAGGGGGGGGGEDGGGGGGGGAGGTTAGGAKRDRAAEERDRKEAEAKAKAAERDAKRMQVCVCARVWVGVLV